MSNTPLKTESHGPQDCGSFFLDATGPFPVDNVSVRWTDQTRPSSEDIERIIERFWLTRSEASQREGFRLFNGPLCRLLQYSTSDSGLELLLGPTDYRDFVGTNLHNSYLRYTHSPEVLANPLGVSCLIISSDGYLVLGYRGRNVAYHSNRLHPIGGCVTPATDDSRPDPYACLVAEINEEIGMENNAIQNQSCLGLVRDKQIVQPELIYDVQATVSADEIRRQMLQAADGDEHDSLVVVRDDSSSLVGFLESHLSTLTPVAIASLLLHGLARWGGGWFASTRGYLHNLI